MVDKNYNRMRKVARTGKEDIDEPFPINIEPGNSLEYANMGLSRADVLRKKKNYEGALESLWEVYTDLSDDPYSSAKVTGDEAVKYGKAIVSRAERLKQASRDDGLAFEIHRDVDNLIRRVERDFIKRGNSKRIKWMAISSGVAILLAFYLFSFNMTGNVIGIGAISVSQILGAGLFVLGILGFSFFLWDNK